MRIHSKLPSNLLVFASVVCLAISTVFTHKILENMNSIVVSFYCFLIVILIMGVIKFIFLQQKVRFSQDKKNLKHIIYLNLTTAIDWILYFIALKYIDPAFTNALVFGITPIASLLFSNKQNLVRIFYSMLILILLALIAFTYIKHQNISNINLITGILLSLIAGIAVGGTTVSLKALSKQGTSITDVILMRYIFTLIASFAIILFYKINLIISPLQFIKIFGISIIFVLLPAYLVQRGVKNISAFNTAIIAASTPALTYLFFAITNQSFNIIQLFYVFSLWLILLILVTRKDT